MIHLVLFAIIPLCCAVLSLQLLTTYALRRFVPLAHWCQLAFVTWLLWPVLIGVQPYLKMSEDFRCDRLSALFILLTTTVVAASMTHAVNFFDAEEHEPDLFNERIFYAAVNAFLVAMTMVFLCNNLGLLWVCIEATTLSSAPLVFFERTNAAVEATWKYLIICSVGIAFALLGTIMIFASSQQIPASLPTLNIADLVERAPLLNPVLLQLGFIFCLLGYGTKAGIFPMHNWLPDAHSEAPAPASAMLSGALLNCALYGIWRISHIVAAAPKAAHELHLVIVMGALTALAGSLFLIRQNSFKRVWAYSSIENVGIILTAIGLGSGTLFFLQALSHSLAKVALFLVTGNIVQASGTKRLSKLHGVLSSQPAWGILLILAAFAASGMPPFGMFFSELQILTTTATPVYWPIALTLLSALTISFVAICVHTFRVVCGSEKTDFKVSKPYASTIMPALLVLGSLAVGLFLPPQVWQLVK